MNLYVKGMKPRYRKPLDEKFVTLHLMLQHESDVSTPFKLSL
jgi:hypothetical protein